MAWLWNSAQSGARAQRPRGHERFPAHDLRCPLGTVLDLSASGMRVRHESKPPVEVGQAMPLTVGTDSQRLKVIGRVAWRKRVAWGKYELGFQFVNVQAALASALSNLAQHGYIAVGQVGEESGAKAGNGPKPKGASPLKAAVEVEDLYAVLGVARTATDEEIRQAYRTLALKCHPDVSTEAGAAERFAMIAKSYSVLRQPDVRKRYDALLAACKAA